MILNNLIEEIALSLDINVNWDWYSDYPFASRGVLLPLGAIALTRTVSQNTPQNVTEGTILSRRLTQGDIKWKTRQFSNSDKYYEISSLRLVT